MKKRFIRLLSAAVWFAGAAASCLTGCAARGGKDTEAAAGTEYEDWCDYISDVPYPYRYEVSGEVGIPEGPECEEEIVIKDVLAEEFQLLTKRGEDLEPGQAFYRIRDEEMGVSYRARLLGADTVETEKTKELHLRLLNYEKLRIRVYVGAEELSMLTYETPTQVKIGKKLYDAQIADIGCRLDNGMATVEITLPIAVLPGTAAKAAFELGSRDMGLRCREDFVSEENGLWYVYVREYGEIVKKQVYLGEHFEIGEMSYVQITGGDVINGDEVHRWQEKQEVDPCEELKALLKY